MEVSTTDYSPSFSLAFNPRPKLYPQELNRLVGCVKDQVGRQFVFFVEIKGRKLLMGVGVSGLSIGREPSFLFQMMWRYIKCTQTESLQGHLSQRQPTFNVNVCCLWPHALQSQLWHCIGPNFRSSAILAGCPRYRLLVLSYLMLVLRWLASRS